MYKTKPKPATLNTLSSESSSFSADEPAHVPLKMYKTPLTKPKPASVNISSSESSSSSEDEPADGPLKISVAQLSHAIQILSLPDITAQQIPLYHSLSADKCIEMFNLMLLRVRLESYSDWPHNKGKEHFLDPLLMSWAGFYSSGNSNSDLVKCFACGIELEKWTAKDNPFAIHRERASECPYVKLQDGASDEPLKSTGCLGAKAWRPVEQLPIERFMQLALDIRAYNQRDWAYGCEAEMESSLSSLDRRLGALADGLLAATRSQPK